jgi:ADP-heptose:LPS heptosyltransferase
MLRTAEALVRGRKDLSPERVRQVLVLEYMLPLGCVVHMTPVFEAMKRRPPQERREIGITVATRGLGLQVLRHSPFVDRLIETPDPTTSLAAAVRTLRSELARHRVRPDCVLTGASDQRTKFALVGVLGCNGWRGGYTIHPAIYQRPLAYDPSLSLIANNLRLTKLAGCNAEITRPRVFFSTKEAEQAAEMLRAANPEGKPVVAMVTQVSGGQRTGWHVDRFVEVVREMNAQGCSVIYVGTSNDAAAIDAIHQAAKCAGTSLAGKTTVSELAAVLAMSDFVATLDTGTMHVGRAVGVPMVVLAPPWQNPLDWMPLGVENVRILRGEDRTQVPEDYRLDEISAQSVIAALAELMRLYPAAATDRERRVQESLSEIDHLAPE